MANETVVTKTVVELPPHKHYDASELPTTPLGVTGTVLAVILATYVGCFIVYKIFSKLMPSSH